MQKKKLKGRPHTALMVDRVEVGGVRVGVRVGVVELRVGRRSAVLGGHVERLALGVERSVRVRPLTMVMGVAVVVVVVRVEMLLALGIYKMGKGRTTQRGRGRDLGAGGLVGARAGMAFGFSPFAWVLLSLLLLSL